MVVSTFILHLLSILDCFIYSWLYVLIKKSQKQGTLDMDDLYGLPSCLESVTLTDKLEENWLNEKHRHPHDPSFLRATIHTVGWKLLFYGFLLIPFVRGQNNFFHRLLHILSDRKLVRINNRHFFPKLILLKGNIKHYSTIIAHLFNDVFPIVFNDADVAGFDNGVSYNYHTSIDGSYFSESNINSHCRNSSSELLSFS